MYILIYSLSLALRFADDNVDTVSEDAGIYTGCLVLDTALQTDEIVTVQAQGLLLAALSNYCCPQYHT